MLLSTDLSLILIPVVSLVIAAVLVIRWRLGKRQMSPAERALNLFKLMSVALGVVVAVLWLALPVTPTLATFGRPVEINSLNEVLRHLQEYNDALVRTIQVVHAFLFLFLFWFLSALFELTKSIAGRND